MARPRRRPRPGDRDYLGPVHEATRNIISPLQDFQRSLQGHQRSLQGHQRNAEKLLGELFGGGGGRTSGGGGRTKGHRLWRAPYDPLSSIRVRPTRTRRKTKKRRTLRQLRNVRNKARRHGNTKRVRKLNRKIRRRTR